VTEMGWLHMVARVAQGLRLAPSLTGLGGEDTYKWKGLGEGGRSGSGSGSRGGRVTREGKSAHNSNKDPDDCVRRTLRHSKKVSRSSPW
jgi:hypothetical protein